MNHSARLVKLVWERKLTVKYFKPFFRRNIASKPFLKRGILAKYPIGDGLNIAQRSWFEVGGLFFKIRLTRFKNWLRFYSAPYGGYPKIYNLHQIGKIAV